MERPAHHRVSFGGARDAETGEDAGDIAAGGASPHAASQQEYDPKSKAKLGLVRRAAVAVRDVGAAKIASGAVSVFLLLSVFSAMFGTNNGYEQPRKGAAAIHLRARELLPIATARVPAIKVDKSKFVQRKGQRLVLGGSTFKFVGASNYYMLTRSAEKATRPQVAEVFETAQRMGISVVRIWAFNDGEDSWNALQPRMGHIDERVLIDGLDWVVNEAREAGVRLIMTLTDSQGDYGGMAQYVRWAAPMAEHICDFYSNKRIRKAFKEYVGALILHKNSATGMYYRDDPTILGWEIANAPVCPGDDSGDVVQDWVEDVSAHVKSLDPNHLVLIGHSGVFGASTPDMWRHNPTALDLTTPVVPWSHAYDAVCEGADWTRNHEAEHVDVAALQVWPDDWMLAPEPWKLHWARQWLRAHVEAGERLKKPLLVSAFAKARRTSQSTMATRNAFFEMVYTEAERSDTIAGTLFWLLASNSYPDYDGYTVYSSRVAAQQPVPAWPQLSPEQLDVSLERRRFMRWEAVLVCGAKRAMGNTTANRPINPYKPDANAWVDGWADVLDVINSHAQVMSKRAGVELSKAALSHAVVPRPRHESPLIPNAAVKALPDIPELHASLGGNGEQSSDGWRQGSGDSQQQDRSGDRGSSGSEASERSGSSGGSSRSDGSDSTAQDAGAGGTSGAGNGEQAGVGGTSPAFNSTATAVAFAAPASRGDGAPAREDSAAGVGTKGGAKDVISSGGGAVAGSSGAGRETNSTIDGEFDLDAEPPRLNATAAAEIDFDDMSVGDVVPSGGGFLARLSDSVTGAFGSMFSSVRPAMDDELDDEDLPDTLDEAASGEAAGSSGSAGLSLDEEEAEAEAQTAAGGGGLLSSFRVWLAPKEEQRTDQYPVDEEGEEEDALDDAGTGTAAADDAAEGSGSSDAASGKAGATLDEHEDGELEALFPATNASASAAADSDANSEQ